MNRTIPLGKFITSLKKVFSIVFLSAVLLPTLIQIWVYANFIRQQEYIATTLCINRANPIRMCSGVCYLSDQLQKADSSDWNKKHRLLKEKTELTYYFVTENIQIQASLPVFFEVPTLFFDHHPIQSPYTRGVFKPPQV